MNTEPHPGSHLSDEQLSTYLDADTADEQAEAEWEPAVEAHLASCEACSQRLEKMRAIDMLLAKPAHEPVFAERMKSLIIANAVASLDGEKGENSKATAPRPSSIVAMASSAAIGNASPPKTGRHVGPGLRTRDLRRRRTMLISGIAASIIAVAVALAITIPRASTPHASIAAPARTSGSFVPTGALKRLAALEKAGPIFGTLGSATSEGILRGEVRQALIGTPGSQEAQRLSPGSPPTAAGSAGSFQANQTTAATNGAAAPAAGPFGPAATALAGSAAMRCLPTAIQLAPNAERLSILDNTTYQGRAALAAIFAPSIPARAAPRRSQSRKGYTGRLILLDAGTCQVVLDISVPL